MYTYIYLYFSFLNHPSPSDIERDTEGDMNERNMSAQWYQYTSKFILENIFLKVILYNINRQYFTS